MNQVTAFKCNLRARIVRLPILTKLRVLIPNSIGTTGGMFGSMLKVARAAMMGRGSTNVRFVNCVVNRENLSELVTLLESSDVKVVIDRVYPLSEAAKAVAHMLGHHAAGNIAISV